MNSTRDSRPAVGAMASLPQLLTSILMAQAATLARQGKLSQAEAVLSPLANGSNPPGEALDLLARVYAQQGMIEKARSLWVRALQEDPHNPRFVAALGRCVRLQDASLRSHSPLLAALGVFSGRLLFVVALAVALVIGAQLGEQFQSLRNEFADLRAASAISQPTPTATPSSPDLGERVQEALRAHSALAALPLAVFQEGTTIRVVGEAPNLFVRYAVETAARSVQGVEALDLRDLELAATYEVQRGDSLWLIAERVYGAPERWRTLAEANLLLPPYAIEPRQRLVLPPAPEP